MNRPLLRSGVPGVGVMAGALNLAGVSAVAVQISRVLFLVGMVLVAIRVITGRFARVA